MHAPVGGGDDDGSLVKKHFEERLENHRISNIGHLGGGGGKVQGSGVRVGVGRKAGEGVLVIVC